MLLGHNFKEDQYIIKFKQISKKLRWKYYQLTNWPRLLLIVFYCTASY